MSFERFYMQIFGLGLLVLVAHFGSRITRRLKIGEVVGQVLGGLVVGPILLLFIEQRFPEYRQALNSLHFFAFVFLSLIAFGIGDGLNRNKLRGIGKGLVLLSLIEDKFGPPSESTRQRIAAADAETLLRWSRRILTADDLDTVLH
jgi:NhaP-type Na+/H+ or K+/H+ antiporter